MKKFFERQFKNNKFVPNLYLFMILFILAAVSSVTALILHIICGSFDASAILLSVSVGFCVLALLLLFFRLIPELQAGQKLCRDFAEGKAYDAFIQNGDLFSDEMGLALRRMDGLIDRQNSLQLSTKQAEFLALQNQINPHFLYNTLESIRGDALVAGMYDLADITEALSTFFRYTITNTRNLATIQDELENVDNYFLIQHYRFGEKLALKVDVPDNRNTILHMPCPKLFMQPLVENAIFHGLEKKSVDGLITIYIEQVDDKLVVSVSDNGIGMPEETLFKLNSDLSRVSVGTIPEEQNKNKKGGIALKNVCRRIKLLFGEEYGMHVSSIEGLGTRIDVTLPFNPVKTVENDAAEKGTR